MLDTARDWALQIRKVIQMNQSKQWKEASEGTVGVWSIDAFSPTHSTGHIHWVQWLSKNMLVNVRYKWYINST